MVHLARSVAFALLLAAPALASRVWVVDAAGSGDFTDIQSAVDVAAEADTILVRPGSYPGFSIEGKGLHVVAFGEGEVDCGAVSISGLGLRQTIVLSGLVVALAPYTPASALNLTSCQGPVRVQDCSLHGADDDPTPALLTSACLDVLVAGADLVGGSGELTYYGTDSGGAGLRGSSSGLFLYSSNVLGGAGGTFPYFPCLASSNGGNGVTLISGAEALLSNADVCGGDAYLDADHGNGGDGLDAEFGSAVARASNLAGGEGALGFLCASGNPGQPSVGPVLSIDEPVRAFTPRDLVMREGTQTVLRIVGEPGESVRLLVSASTTSIPEGPAQGYRHAHPPAPGAPFELGSIPPSGVLSTSWLAPNAPSRGARQVTLQAVVTTLDDEQRFLDAYSMVVVDQRFYASPITPGETGAGPSSQGRPAVR